MVQTWNSEEAGEQTCQKCGARYKVRVTRLPARERDSAVCERCGQVLKEWSGTESYSFTLIQ